MTTTVSTKGQFVLPAEIRQMDNIRPGQKFEIQRIENGEYLLKRKVGSKPGLGKILLACPVKGWFKPLDRSETTANVKLHDFS